MISERVAYAWECKCGQRSSAAVWQLLAQDERPEALRADAPGLVFVYCDACGEAATINGAVLILWSSPLVPVVAALSWAQLEDAGPVLDGLQRRYGASVGVQPVLVPRERLPVLLGRDVDVDAVDPERAAVAVRRETGDEAAASIYFEFLTLALEANARTLPQRFAEALSQQRLEELPNWLRQQPEACWPEVIAILARMAERADAAQDTMSGGHLRLMRDLLAAVAAGVPTEDAVDAYATGLRRHDREIGSPTLQRLWAVSDGEDAYAAIAALHELIARYAGYPDPGGPLREALHRLSVRLLARHDPAADEEAIALLERAREASADRDDTWVAATGNLAVAYGRRGTGDSYVTWRRGVSLLRDALDASDVDSWSTEVNQTNLGLTLANRPGGSSPAEFDEALSWLNRALAARSPDRSLEDWVVTKVNLGLVHRRRRASGDLPCAVAHYRDVIDRLRGTVLTRLLVYAELDLASALLDPDVRDPPAALDAARQGTETAEELADPFLIAWAARLEGDAHAAAGHPDDAAIASWQRAVGLLDASIHAAQVLDYGGVLADALQTAEEWEQLADLYSRMLAAFDALYRAQTTPEGRRHQLTSRPRLARWAAYALARAGRVPEAVEALERARTRELAVTISRDTAELAALARVDPDLADHYREAVVRYRTPAAPADEAALAAGVGAAAAAAHATLQVVIDQIRAIPGLEHFLLDPTVPELLRRCGAKQAVYVTSAPAGTYVLRVILDPGSAEAVYDAHHSGLTSGDVARLLTVDPSTGNPGLLLTQQLDDVTATLQSLDRLRDAFAPVLTQLADLTAHDDQEGVTILVPTGLAGLVPLQSLVMPGGGTLDDVATLHLAPTLAIYAACRRRANSTDDAAVAPTLVAIADTDPASPLPGSRAEVETIAAWPGWAATHIAVGPHATLGWLAAHASDATHLHLACHGRNDLGDPEGNLLQLAGDDVLTVTNLVNGIRLRARLAVASACQSGHFDTHIAPDEFVGLAAGLLQAGAACAIVSLWPVADEATALLMVQFYELLRLGESQLGPPAALRQARLWLRDLTDAKRDSFLTARPALAAALRARGLPAATGREARGPYAAVTDWGSFVAYGC